MEIKLEVPLYTDSELKLNWENGFKILVKKEEDILIISANKEGLISLANHLLNVAQEKAPSGTHFHLDEFNSLETGSIELIVEKL